MREIQFQHHGSHLLRKLSRIFTRRAGQQHAEFRAAEAGCQIGRALRNRTKNRCDALQAGVAGLMAVKIVVILEKIDVDQDQRQRAMLGARYGQQKCTLLLRGS
jgi:hypothetical protein